MDELLKKLDKQWKTAKAASSTERREAREDHKFYDGEQWKQEQVAKLESQGRPALVINKVFKAVNNLIGRERTSRLEWKVLPRGGNDVQAADAMTKALAYVGDSSRVAYAISAAFSDAIKGPRGFLEIAETSRAGVPYVEVRRLPWDEVYTDPASRELDLSDARYVIISRMLDVDLAVAAWPDHEDAIRGEVSEGNGGETAKAEGQDDDYGNRGDLSTFEDLEDSRDKDRERVRVRQHEWWETEKVEYFVMPDGRSWTVEDAMQLDFVELVAAGGQKVEDTKRVYYRAVVVGRTVVVKEPTGVPYDGFTVVPVVAYRSAKGDHFGAIRMMKDPQRERNVVRSRLNESMRAKGIRYRKGALGDLTEVEALRRLQQPNYALGVADPEGVYIDTEKSESAMWAQLQQMADGEIDDVSGMNEAAYGDKSNEKSGRAIQTRVQQQGQTIAELFDNLRFARAVIGERVLALIQKRYAPERLLRMVEATEFRAGKPIDVEWLQGALYANPVDQLAFDVVIEDQAETDTERQASMDQAIQLVGMLPDPAKMAIAPYIIRMSDFAGKDEMAEAAAGAIQMAMGVGQAPGQTPGQPGAPLPEPVGPAGPVAPPV